MRVVIMRGIPGAGKSTWVRATFGGACVTVSADAHFIRDGVYRFDPAGLAKAHAACFLHFIGYLGVAQTMRTPPPSWVAIVVDNTNISAIEIAPYVAAARAFGFEPEIIQIEASPSVAAERNVHGVPAVAVGRMAVRLEEEKLPPFWPTPIVKSGYADHGDSDGACEWPEGSGG